MGASTAEQTADQAAHMFYTYWVPARIRSGQDPDTPPADRCEAAAAQLDRHATPLTGRRLHQRLDPLGVRHRLSDRDAQHPPAERRLGWLPPVDPVLGRPPQQLRPRKHVEQGLVVGGQTAELPDPVRRAGTDRLEQWEDLVADPIAKEGRVLVRRVQPIADACGIEMTA